MGAHIVKYDSRPISVSLMGHLQVRQSGPANGPHVLDHV